jgi:predicted HAD superfamily phosphohydrolase YqeG
MPKAEQIKISDLHSVLTRLQNRQLEFDFFGITSNGIDCIYFVPDSNLYAVEFEVMTEDQKPWLGKLKAFAQQNNYRIVMTTYNNRPHYKSSEPASVLRIETKSNRDQIALIGQSIMTQIFGNNEQTIYEVVP